MAPTSCKNMPTAAKLPDQKASWILRSHNEVEEVLSIISKYTPAKDEQTEASSIAQTPTNALPSLATPPAEALIAGFWRRTLRVLLPPASPAAGKYLARSFVGRPCTHSTPMTRSPRPIHWLRLRRRPRRQIEKRAVINIFIW